MDGAHGFPWGSRTHELHRATIGVSTSRYSFQRLQMVQKRLPAGIQVSKSVYARVCD
jgi:hypothetical protein